MNEPLFLGIDAGGSKTVCLIGDRESTLGRGESGPANPNVAGLDGFRAAIETAATEALADAARAPHNRPLAGRPVRAWIGVAGGETTAVRQALRAAAADVLNTTDVRVSHDARLLLAAAGLDSGVAVVAGTGSSVYGRSAKGFEVKVGGWGHLLGDEGSGYDIVRQALRAVTRATDGRGPATQLTVVIPRRLGVQSVEELRERLYPAPPVPEIARLAQSVLELAETDDVATGIVQAAAAELAGAVRTCRARLQAGSEDRPPASIEDEVAVVAAGGLMRPGSPLLDRLTLELTREPGYHLLPLTVEPATGGLALARDGPPGGMQEAEQEEEVLERFDHHIERQPKERVQ